MKDNVSLLHIALGVLTAVKKGEEPEWPAEAAEETEGGEGNSAYVVACGDFGWFG